MKTVKSNLLEWEKSDWHTIVFGWILHGMRDNKKGELENAKEATKLIKYLARDIIASTGKNAKIKSMERGGTKPIPTPEKSPIQRRYGTILTRIIKETPTKGADVTGKRAEAVVTTVVKDVLSVIDIEKEKITTSSSDTMLLTRLQTSIREKSANESDGFTKEFLDVERNKPPKRPYSHISFSKRKKFTTEGYFPRLCWCDKGYDHYEQK